MRCKFWVCFLSLALFPSFARSQDEGPDMGEGEPLPPIDEPVIHDEGFSSDQPPTIIDSGPTPTPEPAAEIDREQAEEEPLPAAAEPKEKVSRYTRRPAEQRMFGSYDLTLGYNKINKFTHIDDKYRVFYGSPSDYGTVGVDWYPLDFYATFGIGGKIGVYSDRGNTSASKLSNTSDDASTIQINQNSKSSLLAAPLQLLFKIQMSPFERKWVKFSGWLGYEWLFWQEKKLSVDDSSSSSSKSTTEDPLVTGGTRNSIVMGAAAHILLNFLDERSVVSMHRTMGFGYVYLTPYVEVVNDRKSGGLDFSRSVMALGFTFETLR